MKELKRWIVNNRHNHRKAIRTKIFWKTGKAKLFEHSPLESFWGTCWLLIHAFRTLLGLVLANHWWPIQKSAWQACETHCDGAVGVCELRTLTNGFTFSRWSRLFKRNSATFANLWDTMMNGVVSKSTITLTSTVKRSTLREYLVVITVCSRWQCLQRTRTVLPRVVGVLFILFGRHLKNQGHYGKQ